MNPLSLKDKGLVNDFLSLSRHELSVYAFENIFIWNRFYETLWQIIDDNLCIFFKDKIGCFLYLAPLGRQISIAAVDGVFKTMDRYNRNKDISRIENIEQKDVNWFENLGYKCNVKSYDYVCARELLVNLRGDRFKSKRACCNYFTKNNKFEVLSFTLEYKKECLELFNLWQSQREDKTEDKLYQAMLGDSKVCLENLLDNYRDLDICGIIVRIEGRAAGFSFGCALNPDTFCVLYEITDISVKGLAQFIFREFCRELSGYKYINVMDDSGLENLKQVKLSYRPVRLISSYIVKRELS